MSFELAAIANPRPGMIALQVRELLRAEIVKGCQREIASQPVPLEPQFRLLSHDAFGQREGVVTAAAGVGSAPSDSFLRLDIWISPEQKCDWLHSELFLKQLKRARAPMAFEISGNHDHIDLRLLCSRSDVSILRSAFYGVFERCELTPVRQDVLQALPRQAWDDLIFEDYVPPPPYSHLFTRPSELRISPFGTIVGALSGIPAPSIGMYQVVFQRVAPDHDWHHNVGRLINFEFNYELMTGQLPTQRFTQQVPTNDIHSMARDTETKAHADKPFFVAALRIAVIGAGRKATEMLDALSTFSSLIQHGGRPLDQLTERDYRRRLPPEALRNMFAGGSTYRPGFLMNSWELTTLVHLPSAEITEHRPTPIPTLETLPADSSLTSGAPIGICSYADQRIRTCIPYDLRRQHTHLIGATGTGKSVTLLKMTLHDILQGHGIAVIDPHGTLIRQLLELMPREHADRVVYIDPGDREWIPIWNPLRCTSGHPLGRVADDIIAAFRAFFSGYGHRLEHLLRQATLAALHLPDGNLLDVAHLLRKGSPESNALRQRVKPLLQHRLSRSFWEHDFDRYGNADLSPPQHKLSKLLTVGNESLMLSQSDTSFDFSEIMASGNILLVNLVNLGGESMEVLGCFMLTLLYLAAIARGDEGESAYRPFHIYCDEAHRFITDAIEDLITQTRKRNVSLTMAHQYMSQFSTRKTDAISSVGSTVIFRVNTTDATYLKKDLQGRVSSDDLIALPNYEAIVRVGTQIARVRTQPPPRPQPANCRQRIIERSHQLYYRPVAEVERAVRERYDRCYEPLTPGNMANAKEKAVRGPRVDQGLATVEVSFEYEEL